MNCETLTQAIRKPITSSKKILLLLLLVSTVMQNADAQLKRTWKRQIYGGYNQTKGGLTMPVNSITYDMTFVSKDGWLFNSGYTYAKYTSNLNQAGFSGIHISSKPAVYVKQFNLSAGKRFDLLPKWSVSLYSGLSYTKCRYPDQVQNNYIKTGYFIPLTFNAITGHYLTKESLGLHLNAELNFFLCENLMLHAGFMYDFNNAHKTGGFTFGGRMGLMKQKYGTRRISKATF